MVHGREKGLLRVKAVIDSGGSLTESSKDLRQELEARAASESEILRVQDMK